MNRLKVNLFVCVVAAVLLALLLAPAVAQAAAWSVVQSPNATAGNNELHAVTSISANDVWAVGTSENNLGNSQTLILHWDGTAWSALVAFVRHPRSGRRHRRAQPQSLRSGASVSSGEPFLPWAPRA